MFIIVWDRGRELGMKLGVVRRRGLTMHVWKRAKRSRRHVIWRLPIAALRSRLLSDEMFLNTTLPLWDGIVVNIHQIRSLYHLILSASVFLYKQPSAD